MERRKSRGVRKVDRVKQLEIDAEAENRAVAALKQGRIGNHSGYGEKSIKRPILRLAYPVSANRYWRTFRGRTIRSSEADAYKAAARVVAERFGVVEIQGPVSVSIALLPKLTKRGLASLARMDLDNCIKVTLDALNGIAYFDDAQVVNLSARIGPAVEGGGLEVCVEEAEL